MAITEAFAGSETVSTTEHSLTTDTAGPDVETDDGEYQVWLDLSALANGDVFVLSGYEKVQAGDTQRKFLEFTFAHAQSTPNWVSPKFILMHGWDFTLDKISGTDRAITWSIRKDDDNVNVSTITAGAITAAAIATDAVDADALKTDAVTEIVSAVLTTAMTEAYAADGVAPTLAQAIFAIQQFLQETNVSGTTLTVKKLDGSTSAMTFTLDSATAPTSITRAT